MLRPPAEFREPMRLRRFSRPRGFRKAVAKVGAHARAMLAERLALRADEPGTPVRTLCAWCPTVHLIQPGKLLPGRAGEYRPSHGMCSAALARQIAALPRPGGINVETQGGIAR